MWKPLIKHLFAAYLSQTLTVLPLWHNSQLSYTCLLSNNIQTHISIVSIRRQMKFLLNHGIVIICI